MKLTVITQKLLLHVQLHNSIETVKLMSSETQCSQLFAIVCVYGQSYQKIRYVKLTLLAGIAVLQFSQ
jgi:hypothetical protein